jgi:hypothetical protein
MKDSPHQPDAKLTEDWGFPCGIGTKYISGEPIKDNSAKTRLPAESGGSGCTRKYFITQATESSELQKLRDKFGFKTPGKMDQIFPPPKSGFDADRMPTMPKKTSGKPGDWHSNISKDGTHTTSWNHMLGQLTFTAVNQSCYQALVGIDGYLILRPVSSGSVSVPSADIALFISGTTVSQVFATLDLAATSCQNDLATRSTWKNWQAESSQHVNRLCGSAARPRSHRRSPKLMSSAMEESVFWSNRRTSNDALAAGH